jgi:hypothetical protein
MAVRQVYATSAAAIAGGWGYQGPLITTGTGYGGAATSLTSYFAEKPLRVGGKMTATGSTAVQILASINQCEALVSAPKSTAPSSSPEDPDYQGHV